MPNLFNQKLTKDQFEVRFKFIQVFTSVEVEKVFKVKEFLASYSISNQRKTTMKQYFIELVQEFQQYDLIQTYYKISFNGSYIPTKQLSLTNISEGFIIYEKLSLPN